MSATTHQVVVWRDIPGGQAGVGFRVVLTRSYGRLEIDVEPEHVEEHVGDEQKAELCT